MTIDEIIEQALLKPGVWRTTQHYRDLRVVAEAAQKAAYRHATRLVMESGGMPMFDIKTGEPVGFYAELRRLAGEETTFNWNCPRCGALNPSTDKHCPCEAGEETP